MSYKGKFNPKFPKKYKGDSTNIIYRSLWEKRVMKYLDTNKNVLEWGSEEIVIPYKSPLDNRYHRYFPDFIVKAKTSEGIKTIILEVKPGNQTRPPEVPTRRTPKFLNEVKTWGVNQAKWQAAKEYCADRDWEFRILTEKELGIK